MILMYVVPDNSKIKGTLCCQSAKQQMHLGNMGIMLLAFYSVGLDEGEGEHYVQNWSPQTFHRKLGDP